MRFFGQIEKTYKDDQGFLIVCGHASTEALDSQGEVVKREAIEAALPDFMKFGNIREMHQPSAVGKAVVASMDDKGLYIEAKIVDPVAALKCEEGVYGGFSIGGKCTGRDPLAKNTITGLRLTEISVVDRPANPEATFTLFKLDDELGAEEEAAAEPPVAPVVEKGMAHVADLAWMLKALGYLVDDQVEESRREGDNSPVPAKLQAWLEQGGQILKEMTAEEVQELVNASGQNFVAEVEADAMAADAATQDAIQMSEGAGDLEKKGAKFSRATVDRLIAIRDALTQGLNELSSLDFPALGTDVSDGSAADAIANPNPDAQPEGERGDIGTPLGSTDTAADKADAAEDLKKSHSDALEKVAALTSELEKLNADKAALEKRVAELEDQPAAPKAKVLSITKAEDTPAAPDAAESEVSKLAKSKDPVDVMKSIHLRPARPGFPQ